MTASDPSTPASLDRQEVEKFERMASDWWDPDGSLKPLHRLNPLRIAFIRDRAAAHFGRDARQPKPLSGLRVLDIGCGGGLLSEPLARLGAQVVGIDPAAASVAAARLHAEAGSLAIDYRTASAEDLAAAGEAFDVVLAMEVVEHVADLGAFLDACGTLARPGGLFVAATINRTLRAFALAIVGAEYLLRWLPRGTHDYARLVTPDELEAAARAAGLAPVERCGVSYNPFADSWGMSADLAVNYMLAAEKPPAQSPATAAIVSRPARD